MSLSHQKVEGYSGIVRVGRVGLVRLVGAGCVQICHKGAPQRDRPRRKARNINDSLSVFRPDPGLCGRFGQSAGVGRAGRAVARLGEAHDVDACADTRAGVPDHPC